MFQTGDMKLWIKCEGSKSVRCTGENQELWNIKMREDLKEELRWKGGDLGIVHCCLVELHFPRLKLESVLLKSAQLRDNIER